MRERLRIYRGLILAGAGIALIGAASPGVKVDDNRIKAGQEDTANWLTTGGGRDEQHYSPLDQINDKTVGALAPAWTADFDVNRGQEGEPLVVDGVMYISTAWSRVYAFDAVTGKQLWSYDPHVPGEWGPKGCCDVVNRGVAFYQGLVYVATFDGRLVALDARTGKPGWIVDTIVDRTKSYTSTGAPRVFHGKVVIGNGGAEYPTRGYVTAYDAATGQKAWRFWLVPGQPGSHDGEVSDEVLERLASGTWAGEWWKGGGGGNAWDALVYDQAYNRLYIGGGNGAPHSHYARSAGKGDNLFLGSIVAVDADTGKYIWHYQETPGDSWDYTSVQPIMLAELKMGDRVRKVIMHAPKNGFFYIIDRETGKPISANKFIPSPSWATHIDPVTWRPVEVEGARYIDKPFISLPGAPGAHGFQPMAYSPKTGLVYLPTSTNAWLYKPNIQSESHAGQDLKNLGGLPKPENYLQAFDPVTNRQVWRADINGYRTDAGGGGVLATGGNLVFQGRGEITGDFLAMNAQTGKILWRMKTPNMIMAAPITYQVKGVQYVAVSAGAGGPALLYGSTEPPRERQPARMYVFRLGGKGHLPPLPALAGSATPPPGPFAPAAVAEGEQHYLRNCGRCHGNPIERASNLLPDLRRSALISDPAAFRSVVIDGAFKSLGMVSFADKLTPAQAEALRVYLGSASQKLAERQKAGLPER
jgi:quinohemoprotein ethanol dehydrogenase